MGYRSEVRIATTREGYDAICDCVDRLSAGQREYQLVGRNIQPEHFEEFGGCVVFGWSFIKWYVGDLADVTNVAKALSEIGALGIPYEFCRVGENRDDIEFENCDDDERLALHICPESYISTWRN